MTFDLIYNKDGTTFLVLKRNLKTGKEESFTPDDAAEMLRAEMERVRMQDALDDLRRASAEVEETLRNHKEATTT